MRTLQKISFTIWRSLGICLIYVQSIIAVVILLPSSSICADILLPFGSYDFREVTASSVLPPISRDLNYEAWNTLDGNQKTGWAEGAPGDGSGEYLRYRFNQLMRIKRIYIWNGYAKSAKAFSRNGRIKEALIRSDTNTLRVTLRDSADLQILEYDFGDTETFMIEVLSVYPGTHYKDLVVTEVVFWGNYAGASSKSNLPFKQRDLPPAGVDAQLRIVVGAGPSEACLDHDYAETKVIADPSFDTKVGQFTSLCFTGFDVDRPIDLTVVSPAGIVENTRIKSRYSEILDGKLFSWLWTARPGAGTGRFKLRARQGTRIVDTILTIRRATKPHLRIVPLDLEDLSAGDLPPYAINGEPIEVFFAGFPSYRTVKLHIYGATSGGLGKYLTTIPVKVDKNGEAIYQFDTDGDLPEGVYCLGLDSAYRKYDAESLCDTTRFSVGDRPMGG